MRRRVWIFQDPKELKRKGASGAAWYVGWYSSCNRRHCESCGVGSRGKGLAEKRQRRIEAELELQVHEAPDRTNWLTFREEYEAKIVSRLAFESQRAMKYSLGIFERIAKPNRVSDIDVRLIDQFVAKRKSNRGKNPGSTISAATINKDLRHIKAALGIAVEWGYLKQRPRIRLLREPTKHVTFVTDEHFGLIFGRGAEAAKFPHEEGYEISAAAWWRALTLTAMMTGLRIGELLKIRREDVNFNTNNVRFHWADTKGKRAEEFQVHPLVSQHLAQIKSDKAMLFYWPHDPATLWSEFARIQKEAGISLHCMERHEHTEACHVYGFHDFRRAFATSNAGRVQPEVLQKLMRHKSFATTLSYVSLTERVHRATSEIPVPPALKND